MRMLRISRVQPIEAFRVRLTLTDGSVVERDLGGFLTGSAFAAIRDSPELFRQVRVDGGGLVWPGGADLCPDAVVFGGLPPESKEADLGADPG